MVAQWCKIQSLFLHLLSLKLFIFSVSFIYAQSDLIYSVSSYIIQTHLIWGAELAEWREGRCSLLFLENRIKVAEFCKKMCNYGLNSHLKCSFKSILEKKHQDVSPKYFNAGSFFSMTDKNFDQSASIPRNLSCSPKSSDCALVIFMLLLCILEKKHQDVSSKCFNAGSFFSMSDMKLWSKCFYSKKLLLPPPKKVIFYVRHETLIKVLLFQETSPASQKALIAHLLFLFGHILYLLLYTSFIQSSFLYSVSHTMREDIVPLVLSCNRFRNNQTEYWKRQIQNTENRQKQSPRGVL